jgi:Sugar transferases involved in lipopolysaccharide synthesis
MYARYVKRPLDFVLALIALIVLSPVLLVLIIVGAIMMKGNPFFTQVRPGKDEKLFKMIKFRTMTQEKDEHGNLLPDEQRLNKYGKFLRSSSLDELPELVNIAVSNMSLIGPRPQLVIDMLFMDEFQRVRHTVRPGLSGLAQVNGRNCISWEQKLEYDLEYIKNITFVGDMKIIFTTIVNVLKKEDINTEGMETAEDLGDYLLRTGKVNVDEYEKTLFSINNIIKNNIEVERK